MAQHKTKPCQTCGTMIRDDKKKKTGYCVRCLPRPHCDKCGQNIPASGEHDCPCVDSKGPRFCTNCNKPMSNIGRERHGKLCNVCSNEKWKAVRNAERIELRMMFGGECQECGYCRCPNALHFHHLDGSTKYDWNQKGQGSASVREIRAHPERFVLLCATHHIEAHCCGGHNHDDPSSWQNVVAPVVNHRKSRPDGSPWPRRVRRRTSHDSA